MSNITITGINITSDNNDIENHLIDSTAKIKEIINNTSNKNRKSELDYKLYSLNKEANDIYYKVNESLTIEELKNIKEKLIDLNKEIEDYKKEQNEIIKKINDLNNDK